MLGCAPLRHVEVESKRSRSASRAAAKAGLADVAAIARARLSSALGERAIACLRVQTDDP